MPAYQLRSLLIRSAIVAATVSAVTSAGAQTPYDGLWNVTIMTSAGSCEPTVNYSLTVADGKVSSAMSPDVNGKVGAAGLVKVAIRGAYANGQLSEKSGSGKWNSATAGMPCSGRWEAARQ